jgi:hypothetical protein
LGWADRLVPASEISDSIPRGERAAAQERPGLACACKHPTGELGRFGWGDRQGDVSSTSIPTLFSDISNTKILHSFYHQLYLQRYHLTLEVGMAQNTPPSTDKSPYLHLMDGTSTQQSYAIVAQRGDVFLGIKFSGLAEGAQFGLPDKTYLNVLLRSARNPDLAAELDLEKPAENVVPFAQPQLALDTAWPGLTFERVNTERASLVIGLFIRGARDTEIPDVLARIRNGNLFRKLVADVVAAAGPDNCIADQDRVAAWLSNQSKPTQRELRKKYVVEQAAALAQAEFGETIKEQGEIIAAHNQNFKAIFQKHVQDRLMSLKLREMFDEYPPPV